MKRVKIMLMAICLVAVAGGVLAFKATQPGTYCLTEAITTIAGGPLTCPATLDCDDASVVAVTTPTTATVGALFCITATDNVGDPCRNDAQPGAPVKKCPVRVFTTEP